MGEKIQVLMHDINGLIQGDDYNLCLRLALFIAYLAIAWLFSKVVIGLARGAVKRTKIEGDDYFIEFIRTPVVYTIIVLGAIHVAVVHPLPSPPYDFMIPAFLKSLLLVLWCWSLLKGVNRLKEGKTATAIGRESLDKDLFYLLKNVSRIVLVFTTILWILTIWDVALTPIFASAGIAGIAIALAAKDTLANFFGGISIFFDRTYKVGEYIILDSGERGEIVEVGIRSTKMKTRDDVLITIPNSIMANSKVINESAPNPRFRIRVDIGVAYGSDLDFVEQTIVEIAENHPGVAKTPDPRVRVRALSDSSVNFQLLAWITDPRNKGRMVHELIKEIYRTFNEKKIIIPFPQTDIYIKELPESGSSRER